MDDDVLGEAPAADEDSSRTTAGMSTCESSLDVWKPEWPSMTE